jgi:hypothetical protein
MSTHTAGPWHTGGKNACIIYNKDGQPLASCEHSTHLRLEWQQANAQLIAAAPDLLEAARAALAALSQHATFPADIAAAKQYLQSAISQATEGGNPP